MDIVFKRFPQLESERLIYREITPDDAVDIFELRSNPRVMRYMDIKSHNNLADSERMIRGIEDDYRQRRGISWALEDKLTDEFLGYFGFWKLTPEHDRGEIGYALKTPYWNKGYMSEALYMMIRFGFEVMGLHRIEANVNPDNRSSRILLEKHGFRLEAVLRQNYLFKGEFLDTAVYSLLKTDDR